MGDGENKDVYQNVYLVFEILNESLKRKNSQQNTTQGNIKLS